MSASEKATFKALTHVLNFVHSLRMQIDFGKSWGWSTSKAFHEFWHNASALLMSPQFRFTVKNHVQDLGCMISYTEKTTLGPLRDKIDNAVARCNRIKKLNLSLDERAEKLQAAVWPATFYGTQAITIGDKHYATLRRAATNVMVGDHKHASSHIALQYLSPKIQDPLLYVVVDLLTTLRRLFAYYPELAKQIITTALQFQGITYGPATALASYLKRLNWQITPQAILLGPGGLKLSLQTTSCKQIRKQARIAWDWHCHAAVSHRKGAPAHPFDSTTLHSILHQFTDRQRRILALSLTAGWQSNAQMALWNAQQDPKCPWCGQMDTHTHQLLTCPIFAHVRTQHREAVEYISQHENLCWFPLPSHSPQVELLRHSMHIRTTTATSTEVRIRNPHVTFYTDGSCDTPPDPFTRRAAWAIVIGQEEQHSLRQPPMRSIDLVTAGHCLGPQTINRAELYAIMVAAELADKSDIIRTADFGTDSQFALSIVEKVVNFAIDRYPHKHDHWDIIQRLQAVWDPNRFRAFKIKSHQKLEDATNETDLWNIQGNTCADQAAVRMRQTDLPEFDELCRSVMEHYQAQKAFHTKILHYFLDIAYARLSTVPHGTPDIEISSTSAHSRDTPQLMRHIALFRAWTVDGEHFEQPPEPHCTAFWSCTWGANYARLVWEFCTFLHWPKHQKNTTKDPGITWVELAISFMLWSGWTLPVKIPVDDIQIAYPLTHEKVQMLPLKKRSLRVVAGTFRLIVKHIQTFSRSKIVPVYKKQGASSLQKLGFTAYHEGGIACRPLFPNAGLTSDYLHNLVLNIAHEPPFHSEIPVPPIPDSIAPRPWPNWPEVHPSKRDKFIQQMRVHLFRKKNLDEILHPGPN